MKKMHKLLALLLVLTMLFTMFSGVAAADEATVKKTGVGYEGQGTANGLPSREESEAIRENYPELASDEVKLEAAEVAKEVIATEVESLGVDLKAEPQENLQVVPYADDEIVRVIVVLKDESLLDQGFSTEEIASNSGAVAAEVQSMENSQSAVMAQINDVVETDSIVEAEYNYNVAISGVAVDVPYGALEEIRALDNVESAFVAPTYDLPKDMSDAVADPSMMTTKEGFGSALTWNVGYTGAGMRIAIVDTGLDTDHPSFADAPAEPSLTKDEIASVLGELNATKLYGGTLTADNLYYNEKIPYAFNYADHTLQVTHSDGGSDHGTHVAGIAAANAIATSDVVGVAPDAQILAMKVFSATGGASFDDILAALEDAFRLNADAVNMSLGSPAGFTDEHDGSAEIYAKIEQSDMIASISAGNSYSAAYQNSWTGLFADGISKNLTSDPEIGVVSSPASYIGATVVASLENDTTVVNYFTVDGNQIVFSDVAVTPFTTLAGQELTYVMVPGYGDVSDYEGLDVTGKVAVVQRGSLAFTDKQTNAYDAGAIACIIYNNISGSLINMQDAGVLPNVFITLESGQLMAELAGEDGEGTLVVSTELLVIENDAAGTMSDFSSWGVTPDLRLVPDVTAPGGNIYSCYDGGNYGLMSGTSMSAPHIAGMSALVLEYLQETYNLDDATTHLVAESLIMSTAEPVVEPSGVLYSPRKQGAGSANVYSAVTSNAYLTVNGGEPSVSFGDDDDKNGVYTFSFEINNLSDEVLTYRLDGTLLTDQVDDTYGSYGLYFIGETSRELSGNVSFEIVEDDAASVYETYVVYDYNEDGQLNMSDVQDFLHDVNHEIATKMSFDLIVDGKLDTADVQALYELIKSLPSAVSDAVTVEPNGTATVNVTVTLSSADKAYMDQYYENGIYVDGFVRCYDVTGGVDLSLPFMGFYGDWSAARVFDENSWIQYDDAEPERYYSVMFGDADYYSIVGGNPYVNEAYDPAQNVLSPNGDGILDAVTDLYLGMMRGAKELEFTWADEAGNTLYQDSASYVRQSCYSDGYGLCLPFVYSSYLWGYYDFADVQDGDDLTLTIDAYLDDGDEVLDDTQSLPVHIDTVKPSMDSISYVYDETTNSRVLELQISDNYDIAAVATMTLAGDVISLEGVEGKTYAEDGTCTATVELDVSDYDTSFLVVVCDYGCSESYYEITFDEGENHVRDDAFYAYRMYAAVDLYGDGTYYAVTDYYNGWHSFEDASSMLMHTSMYNDQETEVFAAEYVDGYIFGVDAENEIFVMRAGSWDRVPLGTLEIEGGTDYPALDMAYDYANGVMYILTDEPYAGYGGRLATLDLTTGEVADLGVVVTSEGSQALTLACDNDGVLYTIDFATGDLYTIDLTNSWVDDSTWWDPQTYINATYVAPTGYIPAYMQSMTVDHETNELYWAAFQSVTAPETSVLYKVDKTTGKLTEHSKIEHNSEIVALIKPYVSGEDIIPAAELEGILLTPETVNLGVGATAELTVLQQPYNAKLGELTWTTDNAAVATVEDGVITAVGEGRAVITVTDESGASASSVVEVISVEGELTYFDMGSTYYWTRLDVTDTENVELIAEGSYNGFAAAAYRNGYVYASEYGGGFYRLDPETMTGPQIGSSGSTLVAMAFNYADGFMYGIEMKQTSMWEPATYNLVRVNLSNGELATVAALPSYDSETWENLYGTPIGGMAIDHEGNFYVVSINYNTYETELLQWKVTDNGIEMVSVSNLTAAGFATYNYGSMVYSAANESLFWANDAGQLAWIDLETVGTGELRVVSLGYMGDAAEPGYAMNMGLLEVLATEPATPTVELTSVSVPESYLMLQGGTVSAGVVTEPWNAYPEVTYTMADSNVATVDADGNITGVEVGETTMTVEVDGWSETFTIPVTVVASTGYLNAFLVSDFMYGSNYWINFADTDPTNNYDAFADCFDWTVFSGAYFNGKLYTMAQDYNGDYAYKNYFVVFDTSDYSYTVGQKIHENLRDMAFDYTTGNLYAIADGGTLTGAVAQVDTETGAVTVIGDSGLVLASMTIDATGQMYAIGENDNLYKLDKTTGAATLVGSTGADAGHSYQTMHYDLDTGNTYWNQVADDYSSSLRLVDLETGATTNLGTVCPSGVMASAMYTIPTNEPTVPDEDTFAVTAVKLPAVSTVVVGETVQLEATVLTAVELKPAAAPASVSEQEVTLAWSSDNTDVATVDQTGLVTGVSAGTATITAAYGDVKGTCIVTVTETGRIFYAYDELNTQWVSFSGENPAETTVVRDDAEDETVLKASAYTGEALYSYDVNGQLYSVDPTTFERTAIGETVGVVEMEAEIYDWWTGATQTVEVECELSITDMSYDAKTGKTYAVAAALNWDYGVEVYVIFEVDVETGAITIVFQTNECRPGNLLVDGGKAFIVDTYMSGVLTTVDLTAAEPVLVEQSLIQGYWGYAEAGRSLILDDLTGTVYTIRDFTEPEMDYDTWEESYTSGASELCILNLFDGDIEVVDYIGDGTLLLNSLFLK